MGPRSSYLRAYAPCGEQRSQVSTIGGSVAVKVRVSTRAPSSEQRAEVRTVDHTVAVKITQAWVDADDCGDGEVVDANFGG